MQPIHHCVRPNDLFFQRQERLEDNSFTPIAAKSNTVFKFFPSLTEEVLEVEQVVRREQTGSWKLFAYCVDLRMVGLGFDNEFLDYLILFGLEALAYFFD